ncbi:RICIN domain-containing protein [Microbispora sp. NPDC004025]
MEIPARAYLINKKSGLALDIADSWPHDGGRACQWHPTETANQRFELRPTADGGYKFIAEHSGKALDIAVANLNPDCAMQWSLNNSDSQIWYLKKYNEGIYRLVNKHSGLVLAVEGASTAPGARVVQFHSGSDENELWLLKAVS